LETQLDFMLFFITLIYKFLYRFWIFL